MRTGDSRIGLRNIAAGIAVLLPASAALCSWLMWTNGLPDAVATHWSGPGPADRTTPKQEFFAGTFAVSAGAAVIGVIAALVPGIHPLARRLALLASGSVSAVAATQWLVSAGLTVSTGDPRQAVLGAWILIPFSAFAYGVIPLLLAPPPRAAHISP